MIAITAPKEGFWTPNGRHRLKDDPLLPEVLKTMKERLAKFNVDNVNQQDLAKTGGAPDAE